MNDYLTPMQAIRKKCLECSNGQYNEIRGCLIKTCPLYSFRIGEKQNKKYDSTSEQITLDLLEIEY
ncbi:MAG: hypothetical protein AB7V48_04000 [Sedimentibacter sp.]